VDLFGQISLVLVLLPMGLKDLKGMKIMEFEVRRG